MKILVDELHRLVPNAIDTEATPSPPGPITIDAQELESRVQIGGSERGLDVPNSQRSLARPDGSVGPLAPSEPGARLDDETRGVIARGVRSAGVEALAWYKSFHWCPWDWGVFVREAGIRYCAEQLADLEGRPVDELYDVAYRLLVGHETFHFLVDLAATVGELTVGAPLYIPRQHRKDLLPLKYNELEEALANAFSLRKLVRSERKSCAAFLSAGPVGYKDFGRYRTRQARVDAYRALVGDVVAAGLSGDPLPLSELLIDEAAATWTPADLPITKVHDCPGGPFFHFIHRIPTIEESSRFRKELSRLRLGVQWENAKAELKVSTQGKGLNFEKLTGRGLDFSVRLDRSRRAILSFDGKGTWLAEDIGPHDVYRRR